ncbi:Coiled-coil domain-containing protein [Paragonimus westermani]|uniref:Coiled-coil domain-containing protein n=1 Tax=Paragonimus westermani TaxID=34504 RepID=A0A8T0DJW5_9TREM|nr:Coiled-coil domain-containing protein [Paragonimus westermani]
MKCEDDSTDYIEISPRELPRYEIEEQLRFYKEELDKKDELIRDLTKLTAAGPSLLSARTLVTKGGATEKLEEIRTKVEKLQHTIAENKEIIHEKNVTISELRVELEAARLENVSSIQRIEELEDLLQESTDRLTNYKNAEDHHDMILQALQKDVKLKSSKLLELKSQLRNSETNFQEKFQNLEADHILIKSKVAEFAKLLDCKTEPDVCIAKLKELIHAHCTSQTQLALKTDATQAFEFEQRASRETIMRLSGELNKHQIEKEAALSKALKAEEELQRFQAIYEQSEGRVCLLSDRVKQLTAALQSARTEADERERRLTSLLDCAPGTKSQQCPTEAVDSHECLTTKARTLNKEDTQAIHAFINNINHWLEQTDAKSLPEILPFAWKRIQELMEMVETYRAQVQELQDKVVQMTSESSKVRENGRYAQERIEQLEMQRATDGTTIDGLRQERNQLVDLICKLALAAKFEEPIGEGDYEILGETLLVRISQLQQSDTEKQAKQRLQISRLQRELHQAKERSESLELQISIMRRRLSQAQEHRFQTTTPASHTPTTLAASEKERNRLAKQLQQTREDADKLREEIVLLKARLLESSHDKLSQISHSKALRAAQTRLDELNRTYEEQKQNNRKMQLELEHYKKRSSTEVGKLQEQIEQLQQELRSITEALEASRRSEEQLLDFRALIARHLGLDCEHLSVPDYEILVQVDRLVTAHQAEVNNFITTEKALQMVHNNYMAAHGDFPHQ